MTADASARAVTGLHHVAMRVADFDGVVAFYTEALGLTEAVRWGEGDSRAVLLDAGDAHYVEIFAGGSAPAAPGESAPPLLHVALASDDVDAAIERARAAGAEVTMEPKDVDIPSDPVLPVCIAFCRGPAGEVIEFFHVRSAQG